MNLKMLSGVFIIFLVVFYGSFVRASSLWSTFQGNEMHNGYVSLDFDISDISEIWNKSFDKFINPIVGGDGYVFVSEYSRFGGDDGLYAFQASDGSEIWSYKDFGRINNLNPPAYSEGQVFIQASKGSSGINPSEKIYGFDAADGRISFQSLLSEQWDKHYAPTPYEGEVYVNNGYYGGASSFDAATGDSVWFSPLHQYDQWTPAVDENYVYAYLGETCSNCNNAGLNVLDRETGHQAYSINDSDFDWHGWSMNLAPVLGEQNNVLVIHDGRLISFDLTNKNIGWQLKKDFSGQPSVANGVIYAIESGVLTAWDEKSGAFLWSWESPYENVLKGNIVVTDSYLFTQSATETYALDLFDFDLKWEHEKSGSLAIADNNLYIAGNDQSLTVFSLVGFSGPKPPTPPSSPFAPTAPKSPTAPKAPTSPKSPSSVDMFYSQNLSFDAAILRQTPTSAVPEPATMALFATGIAGMMIRRKKR